MRKLFAVLLVAATASANEISYRSLQSATYGTPLHDRGLHGEGQIIAVLDTGLDYTSCYFAEPDGARPPINTGTPTGGLQWENVDLTRRKVVAYDFLNSCNQYPGRAGCDDPNGPNAWDNQGHGTHAAGSAAADKGVPIAHDYGDAVATGAKLVIQDGGFIGGDNCSHRPGFGCPVNLTPILEQAYRQGARIHSNSWGDRQNTPPGFNPPTANYSQSARDVDAFVHSHPDMLILFNTGNYGAATEPPSSSAAAPGSAKNVLQVGGTRGYPRRDDLTLAGYSLLGPTRDGRIKPDVVGPSSVIAGDLNFDNNPNTCDATEQGGTSWSSPSIAGAAALVRQYYVDGFYPSGSRNTANGFAPSAALMKATIVAAARPAVTRYFGSGPGTDALPVPSNEQGFGFPVLAAALYLPGAPARLRVTDVANDRGLAVNESTTTELTVGTGAKLRVVLVWTDPPGIVRGTTDSTPQLVNDLDLQVLSPTGETLHGNESLHRGQPDRLNNVEVISIDAPAAGKYMVSVSAHRLGSGSRQGYALVATGDFAEPPSTRRRVVRR